MTDEIRIGMFEPEGCLYVRLMKGEQMLLTALIHEDGRVLTSKDASFSEIFCREQVCGIIGKNLIIGYEPDGMADRDRYLIVSPEGEVLYRDAEIHWITYGSFQKRETQKADLAILHEGDTWRILDESLAEAGRIHEADLDEKGDLRYVRGTVIGVPCEELGGACSTDALTYLREEVPAARVPGGYLIAEELGGFLPEPEEGWELNSFSDSFILLRNADYLWRVVRRADGEILFEGKGMIFLQNSSFEVNEDFLDSSSITIIYDKDGKELYSARGLIPPCLDEWYYTYRGPWAGIIDAEGNWILRELQYDE